MELRVIIAGSRGFNDYGKLKEFCDFFIKNSSYYTKFDKITIISGTARGADKLGEQYAKERNYELKRFPADWNNLGKKAGYIRNADMAKYASQADFGVLIAFWDGESKGTGHMIDLAKKNNLFVHVVEFNMNR